MESTLNPVSTPSTTPIVKKFDKTTSVKKNFILGLVSLIVVVSGIGTGYLLSDAGKGTAEIGTTGEIKVNKNEAGISDESKFSTTTDGVLEEGGIGGEGTHHIVRGVGPSQYAYLTSSMVDMDPFIGKKVKVWGETMSGKKAGWLIDVGKIKVIE